MLTELQETAIKDACFQDCTFSWRKQVHPKYNLEKAPLSVRRGALSVRRGDMEISKPYIRCSCNRIDYIIHTQAIISQLYIYCKH